MKLVDAKKIIEQLSQESVDAIKKAMEHKRNGENYKWFYYDGMVDAYEKVINILEECKEYEIDRYW